MIKKTVYYIGGYEKEIRDNHIYHRIQIGDVAIVEKVDDNAESIHYTLRDHLGSLIATVSDTGTIKRLFYDPWGKRLNLPVLEAQPITLFDLASFLTPRGFTGHEHLDNVGLIHMNGRVYDPEIARFVSADPFIQDPLFLQDYNRYTYAWNNPLVIIDPSGYIDDYFNSQPNSTWNGGSGSGSNSSSGSNSGSSNDQTYACNQCAGAYFEDRNGDGVQEMYFYGGSTSNIPNKNNGGRSGSNATGTNSVDTAAEAARLAALARNAEIARLAEVARIAQAQKDAALAQQKENARLAAAQQALDYTLRLGQVMGGIGQIVFGMSMFSGGLTGIVGVALIAKGIDNIQSAVRGTSSLSQDLLIKATGSKKAGAFANAALDMGTSVAGLASSVPKLNSLGNPLRPLFNKAGIQYEAAIRQTSGAGLAAEIYSNGATAYSTYKSP